MQSIWSRVAEAQFCSARVYTHIACYRTIIRPAIRRRDNSYSGGNSLALYSTDSDADPFAVFDTAHEDGARPKYSDAFAEFDTVHKDGNPPKRNENAGTLFQGTPPPGEQQQVPDHQYRRDKRPRQVSNPRYSGDMRPRTRPPMDAIEALNSICDTEDALTRHKRNRRGFNNVLLNLHRSYDIDKKVNYGRHQEYRGPELAAVQFAVELEQKQDSHPMREPMSTVQFERYHDMINQMVNRLIIQSYYDELPNDPMRARRNVESLDSAWTAIRLLRSEGYPRYNHPSADPQVTKQAREELTEKIRDLFESWTKENPGTKAKFQVAKMCYNLLVCPVPPSMHHYNQLILGFSRRRANNLVEIVVDSFFNYSRLRPTPQTIVCLLVHYRTSRDILGFFRIIRRMMAIDNRGMLIRRRWYEDVLRIPALHEWAKKPEVTTSLQANWVIERPDRGQGIYEALVSGLLSFDRVKDAIKVFVGSLHERMGISTDLFINLLKHCRYTLDASAADLLARGLLDNVDVVVALLLRDDCPRKLADDLYSVLSMSLSMNDTPSADWSEERVQMISYVEKFTLWTTPEDRGKARRLETAMFIRHTTTYLKSLSLALGSLRPLLRVRDPLHRTVIATASSYKLWQLEVRRARLSGSVLKHQVLQKIMRRLESLTWVLGDPANLITIYRYIVAELRDNLPRGGRDAGHLERCDDGHLERCDALAASWLHYRISKLRDIQSDQRRFELRAQVHLITGQRLLAQTTRVLHMSERRPWRRLALPSAAVEEGEGEREKFETEYGSLWPRAESGAVLVTE